MTVAQIGGAVALAGAIAGGVFVAEDRFANTSDVKELAGFVDRNFRDTTRIIQDLKRDTQQQFQLNELRRLRWQLSDVMRRTQCRGPALEYCDHLRRRIQILEQRR